MYLHNISITIKYQQTNSHYLKATKLCIKKIKNSDMNNKVLWFIKHLKNNFQ